MELNTLRLEMDSFKKKVIRYNDLFLRDCASDLQNSVSEGEEMSELKTKIRMKYGELESYIKKLGNKPYGNDNVTPRYYGSYENAFSDDTELRVGPSLEVVIQDLDFIIGKLRATNEKDFKKLLEGENSQKKNNCWNYVNPFWIIWRLLALVWRHKIIGSHYRHSHSRSHSRLYIVSFWMVGE